MHITIVNDFIGFVRYLMIQSVMNKVCECCIVLSPPSGAMQTLWWEVHMSIEDVQI